jgi:hypothetical protein
MKRILCRGLIFVMLVTGLMISGCTDKTPASQSTGHFTPTVKPADVSIGEVLSNPLEYDYIQINGTVNQTMNVSGYTYVEVTDGTDSIWVAGYPTKLDKGTQIAATGSLMKNFHSSTLNMTFYVILFAEEISDGTQSMPYSTYDRGNTIIGTINVTPVEGSTRIEQIKAHASTLSGQEVKVTAVVVKCVELVNETFLTLEDGTGQLKARCPDHFEVSQGDNVVVTGMVTTDVDFGMGSYYDVLLQITDVK